MAEPPGNETAAPVKKAAGSDEEAQADSHGPRLGASPDAAFTIVPQAKVESSTGRTTRHPPRTTSSCSTLGMADEIRLAGRVCGVVVKSETKRRRSAEGFRGGANPTGWEYFTSPTSQTGNPACQPKEPVRWT